jgi:hypothetical protein
MGLVINNMVSMSDDATKIAHPTPYAKQFSARMLSLNDTKKPPSITAQRPPKRNSFIHSKLIINP